MICMDVRTGMADYSVALHNSFCTYMWVLRVGIVPHEVMTKSLHQQHF